MGMRAYSALLRGIFPGRPGNDALRRTFVGPGFESAQPRGAP